jgi:hypothetical protein
MLIAAAVINTAITTSSSTSLGGFPRVRVAATHVRIVVPFALTGDWSARLQS